MELINNSVIALNNIGAYKFKFNELTPRSGETSYGLLAHQVEKEFPSLVRENYEIDGKKYKTINYKELIPVLWNIVKKINNRIKNIEKKIK